MKRLIMVTVAFAVTFGTGGISHAQSRAYCTINSIIVGAAGHTIHTPPVTVPCP